MMKTDKMLWMKKDHQRRAGLGMMKTLTGLLSGMDPSTGASAAAGKTSNTSLQHNLEGENEEETEVEEQLYASRRRTSI